MSDEIKRHLLSLLEPCGQTHLLHFWDSLIAAEKERLATQIQAVDWPKVTAWAKKLLDPAASEAGGIPFDRLVPAPYQPLHPETPKQEEFHKASIARGLEMLRTGKVAAFTVAGGQGTRLGFSAPKGTFPLTPLRHKSLFQIFAEGLLRLQEKYGTTIPWYIMTSHVTDAATREFFQTHGYFGLPPANVRFFAQANFPAFGLDGKALLESPSSLVLSPNGHGGSFAALKDSGALDDMEARGITTLSYWQVDNPLTIECDPLFIGMHDLSGSDMSSRALIKREPKEKLGHFCLLDGHLTIVEYSDMPDSLLYQQEADGRLRYRAGSPAIHVLSTAFIRRMTGADSASLQPHRANKKVPHITLDGAQVTPEAPNAIKLELFIFDALPFARNPLVLEGDRAEQFAPVKNKEGNDSPESSRDALLRRTQRWCQLAGIPFPQKADGSPDAIVELSPRSFVDAEDLAAAKDRLPPITAGAQLYLE